MAARDKLKTHQRQNHCVENQTKQKVYQACGKHLGKSPDQRKRPPEQLDIHA